MDAMHGLVNSLMGGLVGLKKGRSALGTRQQVNEELIVVTHQSTPGRIKNLGFRTHLLAQVGRLGEWIAEGTMSRRGIQMPTFT